MNWCRILGCRRRTKRPHLRHDPAKLEAAQERLRVLNDRAARLAYEWGREDWPDFVGQAANIYRGGNDEPA